MRGMVLDRPWTHRPGKWRGSLDAGERTTGFGPNCSDLNLKDEERRPSDADIGPLFFHPVSYSTWSKQDRTYHHSESALTRFLLISDRPLRVPLPPLRHCCSVRLALTPTLWVMQSRKVPGKSYIVRQRDAHAWCLIWDKDRRAWRDFDPTPGTWLSAEELKPSWTQRLSDLWARISFEISKFRWGQSHVREYLLWAVLPILGLLLYQILFRTRHRRKGAKKGGLGDEASWPGMDSEFYELERQLGPAVWPGIPANQLANGWSVWRKSRAWGKFAAYYKTCSSCITGIDSTLKVSHQMTGKRSATPPGPVLRFSNTGHGNSSSIVGDHLRLLQPSQGSSVGSHQPGYDATKHRPFCDRLPAQHRNTPESGIPPAKRAVARAASDH